MGSETQSYVLQFKERGMKVVRGSIKALQRESTRATDSTNLLKKAVIGLGAAVSISKITQYTQAWQQHTNMLKLVTESHQDMIRTRGLIDRTSRETRADLIATGKLYQRLSFQIDNLNASQADLITFTRAANISLAATGANASETRSVLLQLGQAMGTAAVNGDEFRSIAENAPRLLKAVADGLKVPIGEVKRLTSEGKLLAKDFFQAVLGQAPILEQELKQMDITLGQAATTFTNRMIRAVGLFGELTGIASKISKLIVASGDAIDSWTTKLSAAYLVAQDLMKELTLEQGGLSAFLKVMELGGALLIDTITVGFRALSPVFDWMGASIAASFYSQFVRLLPKSMKASVMNQAFASVTPAIEKQLLAGLSSAQKKIAQSYVFPLLGAQEEGFISEDDILRATLLGDSWERAETSLGSLHTTVQQLSTTAKETYDAWLGTATGINTNLSLAERYQNKLKELGKDVPLLDLLDKMSAQSTFTSQKSEAEYLLDVMSALGNSTRETVSLFRELRDAMKAIGADAFDGITAGFESVQLEVTNTRNQFRDFTIKGIRGFSDELASALVDGSADFKTFAKSLLTQMLSIMIQAQITNAVLGGGMFSGGGLSGLFGGTPPKKQFGGPTTAGKPTIVGENGPELFIPPSSGKVMPNGALGGQSQPEIRIVNAVDSDAIWQQASDGVVAKRVMNVITQNKGYLSGVLA